MQQQPARNQLLGDKIRCNCSLPITNDIVILVYECDYVHARAIQKNDQKSSHIFHSNSIPNKDSEKYLRTQF